MSCMKIVLATRNAGKIAEFRELLAGLPLTLLSLRDFPEVSLPPEGAVSFRENALAKARAAARATGLVAVADDSGLEVDYLEGAPGVLSARYAGPGSTDAANNAKLLKELEGVPLEKRTARFRCVVAVVTPGGREFLSEGVCEGVIGFAPRGEAGFGYDPLFVVPALGKTLAELGPEVKNKISHRAQAVRLARAFLARLLQEEGDGCGSA